MELNNRVKKLRLKLGYATIEPFMEILFEDFSEDEMEVLKQNYLLIEKGSQPVDVTLLQLILKKFPSVNPKWLLNGIGQFDSPTDPARAYDVRQINSGSADTHNRLEIVERDSPLKDKIIADKETQIKELKQSVIQVAKTLANNNEQATTSSLHKPNRLKFSSIQAAMITIVLLMFGSLWLFKPQGNPSFSSRELLRNAQYEDIISRDIQKSPSFFSFENQERYCTFTLEKELEGISLRVVDYQQNTLFEQEFRDQELRVYHSVWEPGIYYYFLLKEGKSVYLNSFKKY